MRKDTTFTESDRRTSKLYVVLTPDLTIVDATDAYRRATFVWRDEIRGCRMFDVFPDNPKDVNASGVRNLRASFARVLRSARPHRMPLQRYDVRDRLREDEAWVEKFWTTRNTPLFGSGTREVTHILHEVDDVSTVVSLRAALHGEELIIAEERATVRQMQEDVRRRAQELRELDRRLAAVLAGKEPPESLVERARNHLRLPDRLAYWSPGESAPETAVYSAFHQRDCELGSRFLYMQARGVFPSCPRCGQGVLYRQRR